MRRGLPTLCGRVPQNGILTSWGAVGVQSAGSTPLYGKTNFIIAVIKNSARFGAFIPVLLSASFAYAFTPAPQCSSQRSERHLAAPVTAEVVPFPPYHAAGNDVPTTLRLKRQDGAPVTLEDLQVTDAANVDVLVVDEGLSDFHFQHLTATDVPGEYRFVLRSKYGGRYFVWTGIGTTPLGEKWLEKAIVEVAGPSKALERVTAWETTTDEYHFHLSIADGTALIAGQPARLTLSVTSATGEPIELNPMSRGLGCLSAFTADFQFARLMFPADDSIPGGSAQATRKLTFVFTPPSAGYWKLFGEVKPGGFPRVASFGVNVSEAARCKECVEACRCVETCSKTPV